MQDGHTRAKSELHRTEEMLTSSLSGVATLEQSLASASEKYLYMQELRSYVSILCDFLQVKAICPLLPSTFNVCMFGGYGRVSHAPWTYLLLVQ